MRKPHEENWIATGCYMVTTGTLDDVVCDARTRERQEFIAAAPKMARALLANGYVRSMGDGLWHTDSCNEMNDGGSACIPACCQARAVLREAGVLEGS